MPFAARLLGLWVRIPSVHCCLFVVSAVRQVPFCTPGDSSRIRCVAVCDLQTSWMRRPWPELGRRATITKNISLFRKASCWCIKSCEVDCCYSWILLLSLQKSWLFLEWRCIGLKLVKPTGHYMYHQFNIQQTYALPTLYLCVLYLSENKQRLVQIYCTNWLVFITEMKSVYRAVWTGL